MKSIEEMCKCELIELNQRVVERIRYLSQMEAQEKMQSLYYGDVVSFKTQDGITINGKVERFNKKSVSLIDEEGLLWRVSPQLLKKVPVNVLTIPILQ